MNEESMKIDIARIKVLRESRGWSQEHLASVSGLSPRTVQRMEAEGKASHESRMAVSAALGIEPAQLLGSGSSAAAPAIPNRMSASDRARIILWIVSLVLAMVIFQLVAGYKVGKDMAVRDNRAQAACKANPAECGR
jgi:transcriptional regulator with XRE-family HTH domain